TIMLQNDFLSRQETALRFRCLLCTREECKKTALIPYCFTATGLTGTVQRQISTGMCLLFSTGDLFMHLHMYAADRKWVVNGMKTEKCLTRKTHLQILLIAASTL